MTFKSIDWKIVGIALIPAVALSIAVVFVGSMLGVSESTVDRVSQIVLFPIFLSAYHFTRRRRLMRPAGISR